MSYFYKKKLARQKCYPLIIPMKRDQSGPGAPKFNFGDWIPSSVRAFAEAIERLCLIPERIREARLKRAGKTWELAKKIAQDTGLPPEQARNILDGHTPGNVKQSKKKVGG